MKPYLYIAAATTGNIGNNNQVSFNARIPLVSLTGSATVACGAGLATSAKAGLVSREETSLLVTSIGGATTTPNVTVRQTRVGQFVNITFSPVGPLTKNGTAGSFTFTIDSDYRPSANIRTITYGYVNNVLLATLWIINANGVVEMYANTGGGSFAAGAVNNGWDGDITLTYSVR